MKLGDKVTAVRRNGRRQRGEVVGKLNRGDHLGVYDYLQTIGPAYWVRFGPRTQEVVGRDQIRGVAQ